MKKTKCVDSNFFLERIPGKTLLVKGLFPEPLSQNFYSHFCLYRFDGIVSTAQLFDFLIFYRRIWNIVAVAILAVSLLAGCRGGGGGDKSVTVSGAWALYPLMQVWAEQYQKENPGVVINVSGGGAGKGATDVLSGMVDIGMISREAKKDEIDRGGVFFAVAKDAVAAVVSRGNPALDKLLEHGLTREMAEKIWLGGGQMTWGEAAGSDVKDVVRVYTRADSCGAAESWAKFAGGKKAVQNDLKGTAVNADPGLLDAVRKDPAGIGYNNYSYIYDLRSGKPVEGIVPVPIDANGDGKISGDEHVHTRNDMVHAITTGAYPHPPARLLYLMTKGKPSDGARKFMRWIMTKGRMYVAESGYLAVPEDKLEKQLKELGGE